MLETLRPGATAERARIALFDFDGTISTIRSGWIDVMVPMMVETLLDLKSGESEQDLEAIVREYVGQLTGRQTIYQMIEFADQISKRGGTPQDPMVYKHRYLELLWETIKDRVDDLRHARCVPEKFMVPGTMNLLNALRDRGLTMYLASGTDDAYMKEEARLLRVTPYFTGGVFGALDDYKNFSKAILIQRIIGSAEARGEEFLGFGDGYVEIENVNQVGGVTVGVASDEPDCLKVDQWKRNRLAGVGAHYIVPNFLDPQLLSTLFPT